MSVDQEVFKTCSFINMYNLNLKCCGNAKQKTKDNEHSAKNGRSYIRSIRNHFCLSLTLVNSITQSPVNKTSTFMDSVHILQMVMLSISMCYQCYAKLNV